MLTKIARVLKEGKETYALVNPKGTMAAFIGLAAVILAMESKPMIKKQA